MEPVRLEAASFKGSKWNIVVSDGTGSRRFGLGNTLVEVVATAC